MGLGLFEVILAVRGLEQTYFTLWSDLQKMIYLPKVNAMTWQELFPGVTIYYEREEYKELTYGQRDRFNSLAKSAKNCILRNSVWKYYPDYMNCPIELRVRLSYEFSADETKFQDVLRQVS